ncbi:MAG TPA: FAD-dependent oxidoreductase [Alphaproteobacteria bacterium]|nr:FAD-dependent oxidoreductase [Alphaproteobacteria bacterium]
MDVQLPSHAETVIIGGGIAGCSVAYHLTKLGMRDVVLLEGGRLTCGTTWHAAGLIGQMRPNRVMTAMSRYGIDLYANLEKETGLATGWKQCGSVNVARTPERLVQFKRLVAQANSFGVEIHLISPAEAGAMWPLLRTDDLAGAVWLPGDGKANPADLTQSLAKGARMAGAKILEGVRVTGITIERGRAVGVTTDRGALACETVVNCGGQWARELGALAGVNVPLHSAEHFYIVTKKIPGVTPDLAVMRDPDGYIYYKEEVGGLVMGGFEPVAKPWGMDGIPDKFEFQLLPEDWDQFEILMTNALHRTPALESAEVRQLLNGPESFTPDGNFILGEAPELGGFFVCAGFNSAGIANAGGAGRLTAEWIVGGTPSVDLWDVDIRRFGPYMANRRFLRERTVETLGLHYAMRWPRLELESARPLRRSPLYDRLAAKGARFGSKMGWERANYFAPPELGALAYGYGMPSWLAYCREEQKAARGTAAIFDQTSFAKLMVQGRDACDVLQRLCANDVDVAPGRMVYTAMLNARGGFESDLTVMRLAGDSFLIVTGSGQGTRDADWIRRHIGDAFATLVDVTSAWTVVSVMGPRTAEILGRVSADDFSDAAFPLGVTREVDVGLARVRAARMSYIGGPGFELYMPTEVTLAVYDALQEAGAPLGLADAGYYTIDALRVEAGRRAFGAELGPDETPLQAGLMHAVKLDKPAAFIGREALAAEREAGPPKRLATFLIDEREAYAWGGEPILRDSRPVGELTSAGYSDRLGGVVAMGYVRAGGPTSREFVLAGQYEIDIAGDRVPARVLAKPAYPHLSVSTSRASEAAQ